MVSDVSEHFDRLAPDYARLRSSTGYTTSLTAALAEFGELRSQRVLDCGCGAGSVLAELYSQFDVEGYGVDASWRMAEAAREQLPGRVPVVVGHAEALPFRDDAFERVTLTMAVHHLDRTRAFREIVRVLVPAGWVVMATPDPDGLEAFWLQSFFPSYAAINRGRFPTAAVLAVELAAAGFAGTAWTRYATSRRCSRAAALAELQGRAHSTFAYLSKEEYRRGVAQAERELPDPVEYAAALLLIKAQRPPRRN